MIKICIEAEKFGENNEAEVSIQFLPSHVNRSTSSETCRGEQHRETTTSMLLSATLKHDAEQSAMKILLQTQKFWYLNERTHENRVNSTEFYDYMGNIAGYTHLQQASCPFRAVHFVEHSSVVKESFNSLIKRETIFGKCLIHSSLMQNGANFDVVLDGTLQAMVYCIFSALAHQVNI